MSDDTTRDVVQRFLDTVLNRGDAATARALLAPGFVDHHGFLGLRPGPGGFAETLRALRDGFPDAYYVVEDMFVDAGKAVVCVTFQGTHDGPFRGQAPSHRKVTVAGVHVFRVAAGRLAEHWAYENLWSLSGLIPNLMPVPVVTRRLPAAIW